MSIRADGYEWKDGAFRGRRHVINHIDMLLGLGDQEWGSDTGRRLAYDPAGGFGESRMSRLWLLDDDALGVVRRRAQAQSLYAASWEQVFPMRGDEYISPEDVGDDGDLKELLRECLAIWAFEDEFCGGDLDKFRDETALVVLLGGWDPVRADRVVVRGRPREGAEDLCVAVNSKAVVMGRHGNSLEWRAFGEHIAKNGHVLATLVERQEGVCSVCGGELGEEAVVHHVDYDHECGLALMGTRWTKPGTRVQPDCERCHVECPELFEECVSRLRAVHRSCNYLIEGTL